MDSPYNEVMRATLIMRSSSLTDISRRANLEMFQALRALRYLAESGRVVQVYGRWLRACEMRLSGGSVDLVESD